MSTRAKFLVVSIAALTVLSVVVGVLAVVPAGALGSARGAATGGASLTGVSSAALARQTDLLDSILSETSAAGVPMSAVSLPNLLGQEHMDGNVVSPLTTVAPAPMGIGTIGVMNTSGHPTAYTIETSSWEGSITLNSVNSFWLDNDGALSTTGTDNTFGVQLNTVTTNTTVGDTSNNSFWTQNVMYYNLVPGAVTFLDNIWNFSSPAEALTSGTIYAGNGTPVYPVFYYAYGPTVSVTLPATVHLYINSSTTNLVSTGFGYTTIKFGYEIANAATGRGEASGVYDTVLFNSTVAIGKVPASPFLVSGSQLTPTGFLLYDAEIMIGGPGGGTTTSIYGISGSESLDYLDASGRYVAPPSAWNVGTDTGETSEGISEWYTTAGTVQLGAGPSIPAPLWGATPGGNIGKATFSGPLSPSNAFVFFTPGTSFNAETAAWAPTQTASSVDYALPPGTYTVSALLSDHTPIQKTVTVGDGGTANLDLVLSANDREGVYTPLTAWDNAQLAAISSSGTGSASNPYVLDNNPAPGGVESVFSMENDYLYPVFPGLFLAGTTAHVDANNMPTFAVTFPADHDAFLTAYDLPFTNNLQFETFDTSNFSLWGTHGITGWFFFDDYGPTGFLPLANVVIWGGTNDLVGDNTFVSQGSSLLLAGLNPDAPTGNVVWGNTFVNSTAISPTMYPGDGAANGPPIGIFAFESGDLIYNNYVATSITAYSPPANFFYGTFQPNTETWNLSMVEPASYSTTFNGYTLGGTIVRSAFQGGNYWADYVVGSGLPYDEYGYISSGGDYFPLPITAYSVTFVLVNDATEHLGGPGFDGLGGPLVWSVTVNGVTQTTASAAVTFYEVPGTYTYSVTVVSSYETISPSSGTVTVTNQPVLVPLEAR